MLIYLLSDSKQTLVDRYENYSLFETLVSIDNQEYLIHVIIFFNNLEHIEHKIRLYRKSDMELITSGKEFTSIHTFYSIDDNNAILLGIGKKGELYFLNIGNEIHEIIKYNPTTDFLEYSERIIDDEDYHFELITEDINILKYTLLLIENENEIVHDLDFGELTELPNFSAPLLAKLRGKLSLSGLEHLSDESSRFLSKHVGILDISGLENMSTTNVNYLLEHKGPILNNNSQLRANEENGFYIKSLGEDNEIKIKSYKYISNEKSIEFIRADYNDVLDVILNNLYLINGVMLLRAIGISTNREILETFEFEIFSVQNTLEALQQHEANFYAMRQTCLAENIYRTWLEDYVDDNTGDIIQIERKDRVFSIGERLRPEIIAELIQLPENQIWITNTYNSSYYSIIETIRTDTTNNTEEALKFIFSILTGRVADNIEIAREYFYNTYLNSENFSFTADNRDFLNEALGYDNSLTIEEVDELGLGLKSYDIVTTIKNLLAWEDYEI